MWLIIVLILVVLLGIYLYNTKLCNEHFIGSTIHAKVDLDGNIIAESYNPPSGNGEYGCAIVPCPNNPHIVTDNYVCWSCCNYD